MHTEGPGIWRENWKSRKMRNTHFRKWNMARKTEKGGKFWNVRSRTWNMARKLKIMENEKLPLDDLKNNEITEKREKWEMHTERPGIWREKWKSRKMRNTHFRTWYMARKTENGGKFRNIHSRTWNMARKLKNVKNETKTLFDLEYGEKHWKLWILRNEHCRPWNMTKKLKNFENWKTHPIGLEIWRETFKNVKNKKNPLARKPNNEKNETQTLYDLEYCEKHWKRWKMRNILGSTWNMARVLKIMENEKHAI